MNVEYVKLVNAEKNYGDKLMLQSQVNFLNIIKHYKEYELLRKKELQLQIDLKAKVEHTLNLLNSLGRAMPKVEMAPKEKSEKEDVFADFKKEEHKTNTLNDELLEIKRKLAMIS
jgi:hypothetical protein